MAEYTCPKCGLTIRGNIVLPVYCCEPHEPPLTCQHRGPSAGKASCGCGAVYRCNLLNKFCADGPLAFPLYEINIVNEDGSTGQLLSKNYQSDSRSVSESFQACSQCDEFVRVGKN